MKSPVLSSMSFISTRYAPGEISAVGESNISIRLTIIASRTATSEACAPDFTALTLLIFSEPPSSLRYFRPFSSDCPSTLKGTQNALRVMIPLGLPFFIPSKVKVSSGFSISARIPRVSPPNGAEDSGEAEVSRYMGIDSKFLASMP